MGIEPTQPAWKAGILAIELHPHIIFVYLKSVTLTIIADNPIFVNTFFNFFPTVASVTSFLVRKINSSHYYFPDFAILFTAKSSESASCLEENAPKPTLTAPVLSVPRVL